MKLLKIFAATLLIAGAALYLTIANAESYDFPSYSEQAFNQADTTVLWMFTHLGVQLAEHNRKR